MKSRISRAEISALLRQGLEMLAVSRQQHPEWLRVNGFTNSKGESQ
jgi:hypothetical protein